MTKADVIKLLNKMEKAMLKRTRSIERTNHSWVDCSVHYDEVVPKWVVSDEISKAKEKLNKKVTKKK